ncbi:hypothetical protein IKQ26_07655 [bacterium]|nr:hypothetical protein [bacterium]
MNISAVNYNYNLPVKSLSFKRGNIPFSNPLETDRFEGTLKPFDSGISKENLEILQNELSRATAGYRAPYPYPFSQGAVKLLTQGYSAYLTEQGKKPQNIGKRDVVIGGDTRVATKESLPVIRDMLTENGFNVIYQPDEKGNIKPVASPILAVATQVYDNNIGGVLMTASHNPWQDGGYNFLTTEGSIAPSEITSQIVQNMNNIVKNPYTNAKISDIKGKSKPTDLFDTYKQYIEEHHHIDWDAIKNANIDIYYEGFQGTGSLYFPQMLKEHGINIKKVLNTRTLGPEPNEENSQTLANEVKKAKGTNKIGLANDGDSDRYAIVDENGNFIKGNDVLLLFLYHMAKNRHEEGPVVCSQAVSEKLVEYAQKLGKEVYRTPIGFKFLGHEMLSLRAQDKEPSLICEPPGLTFPNHVPEKDGYLALLMLLELTAQEKKPIGEILKDIKSGLKADYDYFENDIMFKEYQQKFDFVNAFKPYKDGEKKTLGGYEVDTERTQKMFDRMSEQKEGGDGYKIYLKDGSSALIRMSGTEPKARVLLDIKQPKNGSTKEIEQNIMKEINEIKETL